MKATKKKLLEYSENNLSFTTKEIEGEELSRHTTETVILEYISIEVIEELVQRFDNIMEQSNV